MLAVFSAVGAWYWWSPILAVSDLRNALFDTYGSDADDLSERIDFPALRTSLTSQIEAARRIDTGRRHGNAHDAMLVKKFEATLLGRGGLAILVAYGEVVIPQGWETRPTNRFDIEWAIQRRTFASFEATPFHPSGAKGPILLFERHWLHWKLASAKLPMQDLRTCRLAKPFTKPPQRVCGWSPS